ncbi:MAG: hypothetical protein CUN55_20625, partial [Phototrophicales bacterium]
SWHLIGVYLIEMHYFKSLPGTILVTISFPMIFNRCYICTGDTGQQPGKAEGNYLVGLRRVLLKKVPV